MPRRATRCLGIVAWASLVLGSGPPGGSRQLDQDALKPFAGLVGSWKGTGQPQRGSPRGAWRESAEWAWSLTPEHAALRLSLDGGKHLKAVTLRPGEGANRFRLDAELADGSRRGFTGQTNDRGALVLTPEGEETGPLARLTLTPLHETRFLLLLEGPAGAGGSLARIAEVGYTRQGVAFAVGDSYPVCIVTEGRGTIRVSYNGQDYWVCCSGCKDLFDDDPAGVIADAETRKRDGK
jgi:YHS domain-containing protein